MVKRILYATIMVIFYLAFWGYGFFMETMLEESRTYDLPVMLVLFAGTITFSMLYCRKKAKK